MHLGQFGCIGHQEVQQVGSTCQLRGEKEVGEKEEKRERKERGGGGEEEEKKTEKL